MQHQLPAYLLTPLSVPVAPAALQAAHERRRRTRRDASSKKHINRTTSPSVSHATNPLRVPSKRRVRPIEHHPITARTAVVHAPVRDMPQVDSFLPDTNNRPNPNAFTAVQLPDTLSANVQTAPVRRKQKRRVRRSHDARVPTFDDTSKSSAKRALCTYNIQLKQLSRRRDLRGCLRLLEEIRETGLSPDKYTYSTILTCCARTSAPDLAMSLYEDMMTEGVPVDEYIRTNLLTVAANSSPPRLEMCTRVFKSTSKPSKYMCNVMMDAYARVGLVDECIMTYRCMALRSMPADKYTVSALVKAYVMADRLEEAVGVIHEMHAAGLDVAPAAFGQVMDAFGRAGALDKAVAVFDSMTLYGVQPTQVSYNILIGACEHVSMTDQAFEIFEEMKATSSFAGDRYTFHCLMKCCLRIFDGWRAFDLYRRIKAAPFPCNQVSYRLALTAAGQMMDLDAVLEVATDIETHKCKPREDTAAFLVAAAIRCSDLESALAFFGDYLKRQSTEAKVVKFFGAVRNALKTFEEGDENGTEDFQHTALVVGELERSWRRGL